MKVLENECHMSTRSKISGEAIITEKLGKPVVLLLVSREGNCLQFGKGFTSHWERVYFGIWSGAAFYKTVGKVRKAPQRRVG